MAKLLKELNGDENFIALLKYLTENIAMVTIRSQPSMLLTWQENQNQEFDWQHCCPKNIYDKIDKISHVEIATKSFVQGFVTIDIFGKFSNKTKAN